MIVYENTKSNFVFDCLNNLIADKVDQKLKEYGFGDSPSQYSALTNSLQFMKNVVDTKNIADEAGIAIEYNIPLTAKRVDFIIYGQDNLNHDNVVVIELKQWSRAEKVDDISLHSVRSFTGGAERIVSHPSYQALSYITLINNFSEVAQDDNLSLIPCAYLHNYPDSERYVLMDPIYNEWTKEAPVFVKNDAMKLRDFITKYIAKKSADGDILYRIDHGRLRPTKALQDCLDSMLLGNQEFHMIDEQAVMFDKVEKLFDMSMKDGKRRVLVIKGGPGTGKSVVAINLLCDLIHKSNLVAYCTKNAAPRACFKKILSNGNAKNEMAIGSLFKAPSTMWNFPDKKFDCLLVDEAHRLVMKQYMSRGENQIVECIKAAKVTVFFIDESQRITTKDIGTIDNIIAEAKDLGISDDCLYYGDDYQLTSQFRCNGSDGYIAFIDNLLGIRETANRFFDLDNFEFKVYDDPNKMRDDLRIKNEINNKARMIAGYCFDWNVKYHRDDFDIYLENDFKARWNLESDPIWAINPKSFDQVGCIHTCQGMEFDYTGVIIGNDLIYRNGIIKTDPQAISRDDRSSGIRSVKDRNEADRLIKDTYKVLLTRAQKGCYVYCTDNELREYIKSRIKNTI